MRMKPKLFSRPTIGHPFSKGLVGSWLMNENDGKIIQDSSGNNNEGQRYGTGTIWVAGKVWNAINFNGTNDTIRLKDTARLKITGKITLSCWVKVHFFPVNINTWSYFISKGYDGSKEGYQLRLTGGGAKTYLTTGSYGASEGNNITEIDIAGLNWSVGEWKNIVSSYDGTYWNLYYNGILVSSTARAYGALPSNAYFRMGSFDGSGTASRFLNGVMYDVKVFNRTLTASEIAYLYKNSFCMFEEDM